MGTSQQILTSFASVVGGGDPYFANVVSGLHMDGVDASTTFTDIKSPIWTAATAQIDTAQSAFGGASGLFSTSGGSYYIATPAAAAFDFGTGDFCVDFWARFSSIAGYQTAFSYGYVAAGSITLQTGNSTGGFILYINGAAVCTEATGASTNTWYFYEVGRSGGTAYIRRGGVQTASGANSTDIKDSGSFADHSFFWGGTTGGAGNTAMRGWLDDCRVTKGVARQATVVPTVAFPDS